MPEEEQITALYRDVYGRMIAYASSVLEDSNLAEEAVQDTFCIFFVKADAALQHENPQGWLMGTLQAAMRNMLRRRASMSRLILQTLRVERLGEPLVGDEKNVAPLCEDLAARADFQLLKRVALDGCTMLEAAQERGITLEACKKRIRRIRVHSKQRLNYL